METLATALADCLNLTIDALSRAADFALAHPLAAAFMAFASCWVLLGFTQVRN
jgi:hypothetical protein